MILHFRSINRSAARPTRVSFTSMSEDSYVPWRTGLRLFLTWRLIQNSKSIWNFSFSLWGFIRHVPHFWISIRSNNLGRWTVKPSSNEWLGFPPQPAFPVTCGCRYLLGPCQAGEISKAAVALESKTRWLAEVEDMIVKKFWIPFTRRHLNIFVLRKVHN